MQMISGQNVWCDNLEEEHKLWLLLFSVNIYSRFLGNRAFKALYTSMTALRCHAMETEGMGVFERLST